MFTPDDMAWYHEMRARTSDTVHTAKLQEAADAYAAGHPAEKRMKALQALQDREQAQSRPVDPFVTFGDD